MIINRTRQLSVFVIALSAGLSFSASAFAHAMLVKAMPAVGSTVRASPSEVRITYSEGIEPRFSGIEVKGADGHAVATGTATADPSDGATLVVPIKGTLAPGSYKVAWHVVSVDTHKTQGSFSFEVKP
jgi:methionine-rich copper-binding protein CopC